MSWFILGLIDYCEPSERCPTKQQVLEAVVERDNETFGREAATLSLLDQDMEIVKITNNPRISGVECFGVEDSSVNTVDCRYSVKYRPYSTYEIATLKLNGWGRWRIESYKKIVRQRR
jgi:hypothetical protein